MTNRVTIEVILKIDIVYSTQTLQIQMNCFKELQGTMIVIMLIQQLKTRNKRQK